MNIQSDVRRFMREIQNVLSSPGNDLKMVEALQSAIILLPSSACTEHPTFTKEILPRAREEFQISHYVRFLDFLIDNLTVEWISHIPKGQTAVLFDVFFLNGMHQDAFLVLCGAIVEHRLSYKVHKCVSLLETFLREHQASEIFWLQCTNHKQSLASRQKAHSDQDKADVMATVMWDDLITSFAALPDQVTSKLQTDCSDLFFPQNYIPLLTKDLMTVLHKVYHSLRSGQDCSVAFLSQLLGKLCLVGYADVVWQVLLPQITQLTARDFLWSRICERLVTSVPDRCLESVIVPVLTSAKWYGVVSKLLGSAVIHNRKLHFLLTNKLLLVRYWDKSLILQNIIGYLADSEDHRHLFIKVLKTVLGVWGNEMSIKHTSLEQHVYITKTILVCLAFLQPKDIHQHRDDLLGLLLPAIQTHLDISVPRMRKLGMTVAKAVTDTIGSAEHKLEYEYETDPETEELLQLLKCPTNPDNDSGSVSEDMENLHVSRGDPQPPETSHMGVAEANSVSKPSTSDLDSDDDLEPYDMSNDTKVTKVKSPVYVRDCMEGLISSDKPDHVEACLLVAHKLIREHPHAVSEIAVEFTKILLHLDDNFSLPGFQLLRNKAMVALATNSPVTVAEYLTQQFYERNYNLRQRMDILHVLSSAAQELSKPKGEAETSVPQPHIQIVESETPEPENWRDVVQRRIDSKTRRFVKGPSKPEPTATMNRFAAVAGHFFFPLMKNFDQKETTLDMLGDDHIVLTRLLYTLGMIIHAALNAPIIRQMAGALLEFLWILRYHPQSSVRQALLFALAMLVLAVPAHMLLSDFQAEMTEAKCWLEDIVSRDPDNECKKLAVQVLVLLDQSVKKEFTYEATP